MNTHETYVSLEVAKLLKEVGFDWKCHACYQNNELREFTISRNSNQILVMDYNKVVDYMDLLSAPTLDVVQRWLREVKNIDVVVSRTMQWKQFYYTIEHEENGTSKVDFMSLNEDLWWLKYEEAQEAGIKKALETNQEVGG